MSDIRIGDMVQDRNGRVFKVRHVESTGWVECDSPGRAILHVSDLIVVVVRPEKPRRTITLSKALAWLGDGIWDLRHDGRGWWVQDDDGHRYEISTTPLKAIIAARNAMGVKT